MPLHIFIIVLQNTCTVAGTQVVGSNKRKRGHTLFDESFAAVHGDRRFAHTTYPLNKQFC